MAFATGYNTTFSEGEVAIAAFEVGAGCGHVAIVWFLNLCAFAIGFVSRRTRFAARDTRIYTPLCGVLAASFLYLATT